MQMRCVPEPFRDVVPSETTGTNIALLHGPANVQPGTHRDRLQVVQIGTAVENDVVDPVERGVERAFRIDFAYDDPVLHIE